MTGYSIAKIGGTYSSEKRKAKSEKRKAKSWKLIDEVANNITRITLRFSNDA